MTKKDLRSGMIVTVEVDEGYPRRYLVLTDGKCPSGKLGLCVRLGGFGGWFDLDSVRDDLTDFDGDPRWDIVKVEEVCTSRYLTTLDSLKDSDFITIWERKHKPRYTMKQLIELVGDFELVEDTDE